MDDEDIEVVEHLKYLGSLKSADGNCNKDTRSRIGMAKKRMLDLVPIWKDKGINKDLKMKLVSSLVLAVLTYGAEGWTLTKADEKRIQSAELWIYRRLVTKWTSESTERITRETQNRAGWRRLVRCAARAADHHS